MKSSDEQNISHKELVLEALEKKILQREAELKSLDDALQKHNEAAVDKVYANDEMFLTQCKDSAVSEMIQMIAHQWRQPITRLGLLINTILFDIELDELDSALLSKNLQQANELIQYLSHTIDDFRYFFSHDTSVQSLNVSELLDRVLEVFGKTLESKHIALEVRGNLDSVITTRVHELSHVVLNILRNAHDALIENGVNSPKVNITIIDHGSEMEIIIQDNAGGIDEAIRERIFEPYFSTKESKNGTGLGLFIAKSIVEQHLQGSINVEVHNGCSLMHLRFSKSL